MVRQALGAKAHAGHWHREGWGQYGGEVRKFAGADNLRKKPMAGWSTCILTTAPGDRAAAPTGRMIRAARMLATAGRRTATNRPRPSWP